MNRNTKSGKLQISDILTVKATYRLPFGNDLMLSHKFKIEQFIMRLVAQLKISRLRLRL